MKKAIPRYLQQLGFLALSALMTLGTLPFHSAYYMEPDDYLLSYIANGSYGEVGSAHLVYIRIGMGLLLKTFYYLNSHVNWYAVLLLTVLLVSFTVIYSSLWEKSGNVITLLLSALMQAMIVPFFLTYTVVAFLAAAAGLMAILTAIDRGISKKKCKGYLIAGFLLLYLAWQMRHDTVIPACALASFLYLGALIRILKEVGKKKLPAKTVKLFGISLMIFMAVMLGDVLVEKAAYKSPIWSSFTEFNQARTGVVDYPYISYDCYENEFQKTQLSRTDYICLCSWKFADKVRFPAEKMKQFQTGPFKSYQKAEAVSQAQFQFTQTQKLLCVLPLLALLIVAATGLWGAFCGFGIVAVDYALIAYLLLIRMRLVMRVSLPITLSACLLIFFAQQRRKKVKAKTKKKKGGNPASYRLLMQMIVGILFVTLLLLTTKQFRTETASFRRSPDSDLYRDVKAEIESHPERLYILDGTLISYLYYYDHPIQSIKTEPRFLHITRSGSWDSFSERYYRQAEHFQLKDPDRLLLAPLENDNVFVVTQDLNSYTGYYQEEMQSSVQPEVQEYAGRTSPIYILNYRSN